MKVTVTLRDSDDNAIHAFSGERPSLAVMGGAGPAGLFGHAAGFTVDVDCGLDEFTAEHLDEIIGLAAMAVAWREDAKRPHPDERSQKKSLKAYMRYATVLDTIGPELRGWLLTRVPKTDVKLMEGG